jgi:hypothetical protein
VLNFQGNFTEIKNDIYEKIVFIYKLLLGLLIVIKALFKVHFMPTNIIFTAIIVVGLVIVSTPEQSVAPTVQRYIGIDANLYGTLLVMFATAGLFLKDTFFSIMFFGFLPFAVHTWWSMIRVHDAGMMIITLPIPIYICICILLLFYAYRIKREEL